MENAQNAVPKNEQASQQKNADSAQKPYLVVNNTESTNGVSMQEGLAKIRNEVASAVNTKVVRTEGHTNNKKSYNKIKAYGDIVAQTIKNIDAVRGGRGSIGDPVAIRAALHEAELDAARTTRDIQKLKNDKDELLFDLADLRIKEKQAQYGNLSTFTKKDIQNRITAVQKRLNEINGVLPEPNITEDHKKIQRIVDEWKSGKRDWKKEILMYTKAEDKLKTHPEDRHAQGEANRARTGMHTAAEQLENAAHEAELLTKDETPNPVRDEGIKHTANETVAEKQYLEERRTKNAHLDVVQLKNPRTIYNNERAKESAQKEMDALVMNAAEESASPVQSATEHATFNEKKSEENTMKFEATPEFEKKTSSGDSTPLEFTMGDTKSPLEESLARTNARIKAVAKRQAELANETSSDALLEKAELEKEAVSLEKRRKEVVAKLPKKSAYDTAMDKIWKENEAKRNQEEKNTAETTISHGTQDSAAAKAILDEVKKLGSAQEATVATNDVLYEKTPIQTEFDFENQAPSETDALKFDEKVFNENLTKTNEENGWRMVSNNEKEAVYEQTGNGSVGNNENEKNSETMTPEPEKVEGVLRDETMESAEAKFAKAMARAEAFDKEVEARREKAGSWVGEKVRGVGNWWKGVPTHYKLLLTGGLVLSGAGAALIGSATLGGAITMIGAATRFLGGSALFVTFEEAMRRSHEKKTGAPITPAVAARQTLLAGTLAAIIGGGLLSTAVHNVLEGGVGAMTDADKIAKLKSEIAASQTPEHIATEDAAVAQAEEYKEWANRIQERFAQNGMTIERATEIGRELGDAASANDVARVFALEQEMGITHNEFLKMLGHEGGRIPGMTQDVIDRLATMESPTGEISPEAAVHPPTWIQHEPVPQPEIESVPQPEIEHGTIPQEISPDDPKILTYADQVRSKDVDGLFGTKGIFGFGSTEGMKSLHWTDPKVGFGNKTVSEVMQIKLGGAVDESVRHYGIDDDVATKKMQGYLENIKSAGITAKPNETITDYIRRAAAVRVSDFMNNG